MLVQIGAALTVVLLTGSAFAQTFDRPFDPTRRNVQTKYRMAPAKSTSTTTVKPDINPYAGQIGVPAPPSAYTGTYGSRMSGSSYGAPMR